MVFLINIVKIDTVKSKIPYDSNKIKYYGYYDDFQFIP